MFVNVAFTQPPPLGGLYSGGKPRGTTVPNNIRALVRTGPSRSKAMFDQVAVKISDRWDEIVNDASLGARSLDHLTEKQQKGLKKLHAVVFSSFEAAMENEMIIPSVRGRLNAIPKRVKLTQVFPIRPEMKDRGFGKTWNISGSGHRPMMTSRTCSLKLRQGRNSSTFWSEPGKDQGEVMAKLGDGLRHLASGIEAIQ
jgi:hypothetical protein